MKPLIKWPGGKSREYDKFKKFIPPFTRYFEPFVGGGGVLFKLQPDIAIINDIDTRLMNFYHQVRIQDHNFYNDLHKINQDWLLIEKIVPILLGEFLEIFPKTITELEMIQDIKNMANAFLEKTAHDNIFTHLEYVPPDLYEQYLHKSILSKTHRIRKLQLKHETIFDELLLKDHLMTAIKAAYYTLIRDEIFNSEGLDAASFYFIREFCYGSMFRFNSEGKFNIPYGGINYNHKDFESKIHHLKSEEITSFFSTIETYNLDFPRFFQKFHFTEDDFIFLDPPYDSNFKNYGQYPFGEDKQKELAKELSKLNAQWMLVIKDTPLIRDLYQSMENGQKKVRIEAYDKSYTYNVRGRNDRQTSHLLIMNY